MTPTQCAFEAGYKNRSRQNAGDLRNATKFPLVTTYIKELEAEAREKYGIDFHKHIEQLGKIRNKALKDKTTLSSAVTSEVARGKAAGIYIDRRQTTNVNLELDKMSYEDLIEKMSEMEKILSGESQAHRNHNRPGKCKNCSRKEACPERLDN